MSVVRPQPDRLSFARKLGFTVGDYACNLYWQSLSIFLLFFYTDAVGLPAATAGLIYMVASIWDGMIDPVIGAFADRTRSRWGRYRPYVLLAAVPLALAFCLLYFHPPLKGWGLGVWLLAAHMIFRTAYAVLSIPYTSLNARITSSSRSCGSAWAVIPSRPTIVSAVIRQFTIASSTASTVARYSGVRPGPDTMAAGTVMPYPGSSPPRRPRLPVAKARNRSPDPFDA